jgi:glycosyltransferase involved in cell wall biosynthesis
MIAIVSCFYNSAARLDAYCRGLEALDTRGLEVEYIFIDNNSADNTYEKLSAWSSQRPIKASLVREPQPGLMYARSTGVAQASGDLVVFFDDDNIPQPDYLQAAAQLAARYPQAVVFSGNAVLPGHYSLPPGLREEDLGILVIRRLSGELEHYQRTINDKHGPVGAGMVCRREDLAIACREWRQGNKTITGRCGEKLSSGEDDWLVHFLLRNGRTALFSDKLELEHRVDPLRLQPAYLARLALAMGLEREELIRTIQKLRPEVRIEPRDRPCLLYQALFRLPAAVLRYYWKPGGGQAVIVCQKLGYLYALVLRRFKQIFP